MQSITVKAPATVANLGSGFDLMGLAIHQTADEVTVTERSDNQVILQEIIGDGGLLPRETAENTCTVAIVSLLKHLDSNKGFDVILKKHIAFNSGLGSSASSAVAGVFAVNALLGNPLSKKELIPFAVDGEYVASKGFHGDNVAPCMLGGITYIQSLNPLCIEQLAYPENTFIVVLYQYVKVSTAEARAILPKQYDKAVVTQQTARTAALLTGLNTSNDKLIQFGLGDEIATPYRKQLIPHFDALEDEAMKNGAVGFNISGSGPSVFAWCNGEEKANQVKQAWQTFMQAKAQPFEIYCSPINNEGVSIC
ncbi:MAG: homoserine kinase [Chitinophagales bacterium]|nr:homoserine kinase [Chitinophagales bacterium]